MKSVADTLKKFGMTDDEILEVVLKERLTDACSLLRSILSGKWDLSLLDAMNIIKSLKKELL